jgi:hypothetical protein
MVGVVVGDGGDGEVMTSGLKSTHDHRTRNSSSPKSTSFHKFLS